MSICIIYAVSYTHLDVYKRQVTDGLGKGKFQFAMIS